MADPLQDQIDLLTSGETPSEDQQNEQIAENIRKIVQHIDKHERMTRDRMLRLWKYLELLWSGAGNYYWDHSVGQWRAITQEDIALLAHDADIDPTLINKVINVSRPYGESMIGVLTTGLPRVKYFPKNADDDLDIQASKAYSNIEKKIVDDNMMPLKLMEMIVKLWNGGFVACYNYSHSDKKYGVVNEDVMEDRDYTQKSSICTNCGKETLGDKQLVDTPPNISDSPENMSMNTEKSPDEMLDQTESIPPPPELDMMPPTEQAFCEDCGTDMPHLTMDSVGFGPMKIGTQEVPKSRQLINCYGPLNVKIPTMAARKEHITWLILEEEIDIALARHQYPDHRDKIGPQTGSDLDIDRITRSSYEVAEDTLREHATIRKVWLTPPAFEKLEDVDQVKLMKTTFPTGVKAVFCALDYLEAEEEDLNDHWTISINPLYPRVMADPLGKALIGLHETANDLFQLEVDTVRYSIPMSLADPQAFDFNAFKQTRALPGAITPIKVPAGKTIKDVFSQTQTATIPKEVSELDVKVERLLQFISGVLPAVFGGPASGSKTFGEYEQAKNQALQRLSIIWKIICVTYAELMAKATKAYKQDLKEDEFFVKEQGEGTYINVWIRQESLRGAIGEVRPELSEQFPMTWGQISARIMELLTGGNQAIAAWLLHPENAKLVYQTIGVDDLYIPGEDQRDKQLYEISQMLLSQPVVADQLDPMTGQAVPVMQTTIPIEEIDDDAVHIEVVKAFLNSPIGIDLKISNPGAYQNIMLHYQMHMMRLQQQMMQQQAQNTQDSEGDNNSQSEEVK